MITIHEEHLTAIEKKIETLQKEFSQSNAEAMVEKELELRALHTFSLKLNRALVEKFQGLRTKFESDLRSLEYRSQMSVLRARN